MECRIESESGLANPSRVGSEADGELVWQFHTAPGSTSSLEPCFRFSEEAFAADVGNTLLLPKLVEEILQCVQFIAILHDVLGINDDELSGREAFGDLVGEESGLNLHFFIGAQRFEDCNRLGGNKDFHEARIPPLFDLGLLARLAPLERE